MNGILAAVVLSLASANAAPTPQDFYSQAYHTHSLYPSYNIQYQSLPLYPYSNYQPLFPQPVYVQQPQPVSPLCLNSSEVKKIEADFQAAAEKIKNENERNKESTTKLDQNIDVKSVDTATHQDVVGKTSSGVDCINDSVPLKGNHFSSVPSFPQNSADPIFGPEVGAKYEVHYSSGGSQPPALPYFSSYSAYSAPPAFPAYPDFSVYSAYPVFGGSNPFAGFGSGGFELTPSNGNKIEGVPTSSPPPPGSEISTVDSIKAGDVSNPLIVKSDEISKEPSTTVTNETSSEFDFIGSPPSIDGPGKLSKKKRGQRKNDKKNA